VSFVSSAFAGLFIVVLLARLTVGRTKLEPTYLGVLLTASIVFYAWHEPAYLLIIFSSVAVDYFAALGIAAAPIDAPRRRRLLWLSIGVNLGLLGSFKYVGFFLETARNALAIGAVDASWLPHPEIILPMGISFYTFQSMSYTIDVHRGALQPQRSFLRLLLFVSFFPQLVAGPIVRGRDFLYQLPRPRPIRAVAMLEGAYLMARGFFLKLALADNFGPIVDAYWTKWHEANANALVAALCLIFFACQIFCDFAGYSSIARGAGYILGFRLPRNFNSPYIAGTFSDFWRRWHITLSTWLRDYLYVPLGGNRVSPQRTYINLMIVMLLGGLWHGAGLSFIVWGALHGAGLAIERVLGMANIAQRSQPMRALWFVVVQLTVLVTWTFFRASDPVEGVAILSTIVTGTYSAPPTEVCQAAYLVIPIVGMHLYTLFRERGWVRPLSRTARASLAGAMIFATLAIYGHNDAFIYFQF